MARLLNYRAEVIAGHRFEWFYMATGDQTRLDYRIDGERVLQRVFFDVLFAALVPLAEGHKRVIAAPELRRDERRAISY